MCRREKEKGDQQGRKKARREMTDCGTFSDMKQMYKTRGGERREKFVLQKTVAAAPPP
jgi:hypothetical protein